MLEELPIAELFGRDPLDLTKEDLDRIVEKYRSARELFFAGVKPVKEKKKAKAPDLDLLDNTELDLDLLG